MLAAKTTNISTDFSQLDPMVTATLGELERAGIEQRPEAVAADAGYCNEQHMDEVVANKHIPVLVAPDKGTRATPKRWLSSARARHGCAACLAQSTDSSAIENANRRSSRCSATPSTTAASRASIGEAGSRCGSSGGY